MRVLLRQLPNTLSAIRLVLAPVAAWLILHDHDVAALCVFVFAGLTDAVDGYLARHFGLASRFGAMLDPLADKLLMLASYLSLTWIGAVPLWLTVMVIGRDVLIVLGAGLARFLSLPLVLSPSVAGKASTVMQVLYIALVLLLLTLHEPPPVFERMGEIGVAVLVVWSFLGYAQGWLKAAFRRVPQRDGIV